jgi:hypothetical protein
MSSHLVSGHFEFHAKLSARKRKSGNFWQRKMQKNRKISVPSQTDKQTKLAMRSNLPVFFTRKRIQTVFEKLEDLLIFGDFNAA